MAQNVAMKVIAAVLGLVTLLAIRSALYNGVQTAVTSATTNKSGQCLVLVGATTSLQDGGTYIVGSIRNQCDRPFLDVTTVFKLDPPMQGPMTHSSGFYSQAYSREVKPHELRKFKSAMPVPADTIFHLDSIRGF